MAQEDDLRALGKIMDFLRAVSIILAIIPFHSLHQAVFASSPGALMFGNQGRESRKDELEQDFYGSCSWLLLVLPQLVDIIVAYILFGQCHAVHLYNDSRLYLPIDGWTVDEPTLEAQPHGGCLQ